MKYMFKILKIYGGLAFLVLGLMVFSVSTVRAATCSQNTNLDFVANAPNGNFIANARITVYKQVNDIDNQPKPGQQVASANTDKILGTAHLSWREDLTNNIYAVKVQPASNNDQGSFWYYNEALACGQTATLSKTLSGIVFSLHNSNGEPLLNAGFKVYSQVYDSSNNPQRQLNQLLASPNSGVSGQTTVYLPQGSVRSMTRAISDNYALNINRNGQNFNFYNIKVKDGQLTTLNYFIPALKVKLQDITGALFPEGTRVAVFKQTVDTNNLRKAGKQVGNFTLDSAGSGSLDLPPALYVLGIKNQNNTYQYFWDMQVVDGQANTYTVTAKSSPLNSPLTTNCPNNSRFTLILQNMAGELIPGMNFALYEQNTNVKGLPLVGNKIGSGQINNTGQASFNFRPDPRKLYALKVWGHNSNLGAFWFFSAVRLVCGHDKTITKSIPALHIILRDSQGQLKRNYNFSLYKQEYDADNRPFFQNSDLIANFRTDGGGQTTVYVAPYNPYNPDQSGIYALMLKNSSGNEVSFYNIKISVNKDYTFQAILSGISGELRDAYAHLLANKNLELYQEDTSGPYLSLGRRLFSVRTDANGKFSFEYPSGRYALVSLDSFKQKNIFWNITIKPGNNYQLLKTNMASFSLSDPQGQGMPNNPTLILYSLVRGSKGAYHQDKQIATIQLSADKATTKSLSSGAYLAVYKGLGNQQYGRAFYLKNGKFYAVKISINSKYLVSANRTFWLPGALTITPLSSPVNSSPNSSSSVAHSLAARLKGRILLQVQDKGQAWYVNPTNEKKYALLRPRDAFNLMRRFALGISNSNFQALKQNPRAWRKLAGRILLKPEDHGRAYYFDPVNLKLYYLGRPADAFNIMKIRGLGITNSDLSSIEVGN